MATPIRTATGAAGAVTLNTELGVITTESLTIAAAAKLDYVVTNSEVNANSIVLAQVSALTDDVTEGVVAIACVPAAGSFTVRLQNVGATALDESITFSFLVRN